jgi:diguanylate cyclase (GGDEF)-like protein
LDRLSHGRGFDSLAFVTAPGAASDLVAISLRGARVLIVDDDPLQCSHLAQVMKEWDAEPFTAQSLADALRLHKEARPDLVLLDVMMPHVDGYKLAQMFKRNATFVPIIRLTALEDIDSKRRGLSAGADEFLIKPVNTLELQIRMSSMLRIKRLADELERLNKELAELATVDPLTQVANRRAVEPRLAHEFQRARRYKHPFTCIMVDIDHFKAVNDKYGHPVGDKVLIEVAAAIRQSTRNTDMVARFGGEEFIVLAPETSALAGGLVADRIRQSIAKRTSSKSDQGLPGVTASLGVASTELPVTTETELVARADQALYRAKHEGRNRVVVASE